MRDTRLELARRLSSTPFCGGSSLALIVHPYFGLSRRHLAIGTILAASAWALLTLILVSVLPADHVAEIRTLVAAPTTSAAEAQLSSWAPGVFHSFSFRSLTLGLGLLVGTALHLSAWRSRRQDS